MKRLTKIAAVALVLGLLAAIAVSALVIEGTGTLKARGAGIARVSGDGTMDIRGHGVGTVWVRNAETLSSSGRGVRMDLPRGIVFFGGWSGAIHASGEELTVTMAGRLIQFAATGTGTAFLQGRGSYWLNGEEGEWSLTGTTIQLETTQ